MNNNTSASWISQTPVGTLSAWTHALYFEFAQICYSYSVSLPKPLIEVCNMGYMWGQWQPERRMIRISQSLIEKHDWDVVVNILKHEMAHQIVSEIFNSNEGHGPLFQKACEWIGLSDEFRRAQVDIEHDFKHWKDKPTEDGTDKLLRRVEKLLSLANSDNEHEAMLAMETVQKLYERNTIDSVKSQKKMNFVYLIINHKKKRIESVSKTICSILGEFYFVTVIMSELFDAKKQERHKIMQFMGTRENVLMAEYVYFFLFQRVQSMWAEFRKTTGAAVNKKSSYQSGVLSGYRTKLAQIERARRKSQQQNTPAANSNESLLSMNDLALIKMEQEERDRYIKTVIPRMTTRANYTSGYDAETYSTGQKDGQNIVLSKGITSNHNGTLRIE